MKIQSINFVHAPQSVQGPHRAQASAKSASNALGEVDQLDISPKADQISRNLDGAGIRADRVAQIRAAIEAGTYESQEKISLALDRLIDEIA